MHVNEGEGAGYKRETGDRANDRHELLLVPQPVADGWQALCSCDRWSAFETFYTISDRDALIAALQAEHRKHLGHTPTRD